MKRVTAKEWETRARDAETRLGLAQEALNALAAGDVQWFGPVQRDGLRVRVGGAHLTRAHGGLVLLAGQVKQADGRWDSPYVATRLLDVAVLEYEAECRTAGRFDTVHHAVLEMLQRAVRERERSYAVAEALEAAAAAAAAAAVHQ